MRIRKLELQAFGPFKERVIIDFDNFNGLFLISGETGSGKTTIFDAISYGLFGKMTGEFKDEKNARCQYADQDTIPEVILYFTAKGKDYKVIRQLSYRKKGNKNDTQGAVSLLEYDGSDFITLGTKKNLVDELIRNLVGFGFDQFKKVVVLPQGEFLDILNAKTNEKEALLEAFFDAEIYQKIQFKLKDKFDESYKAVSESETKMSTILESSGSKTIDELENKKKDSIVEYNMVNTKYEEKKKYLDEQNDILKQIKENNERVNNLNRAVSALETLRQSEKEINDDRKYLEILKGSKELKPKYDSILKAEESLRNALKNKESELEIKSELDKHKEEMDEIPAKLSEVEIEISSLNKRIESKTKIKNFTESLKKNDIELKILKEKLDESEKQVSLLNTNIKTLEEEKDKHSLRVTELIKLTNEYDQGFENEVRDLEKRKKEYDNNLLKITSFENEEKTIRESLIQLIDDLKIKTDIKTKLEYEKSLAALGAYRHLVKENEKCPLCGSVSHPEIIEIKNFDQAELEKAEKNLNDVKERKIKLEEKLELNLKSQKELKQSEIGLTDKSIFDSLQEKIEKSNLLIKENELRKEELNSLNLKVSKLDKDIKDAKLKLSKMDNEEDKKKLSDLESRRDRFNEEIESLKKDLLEGDFDMDLSLILMTKSSLKLSLDESKKEYDKNSLRNATNLENIEKSIRSIEIDLEEQKNDYNIYVKENGIVPEEYIKNFDNLNLISVIETKVKNYDNQNLKLSTEISTLKNQIKLGEILVDTDLLESQIREAQEEIRVKKIEVDTLFLKSNEYKKALTEYETLRNENSGLLKRHAIIKDLYDAVSGNLKGQKKVSLKRYVLMKLFDHVVEYANHYLIRFTDSRYYLKRVEPESGSDRGLDLEVFDSQTSSYRDVSNISGGESFMASLALALGMSEYISNVEGGIRIENVFIDEGFGSLDSQTIDQAINSLMELTQSGRLIGIISHVDQVKGQIHQGINVIKNKNGSTIEVMD